MFESVNDISKVIKEDWFTLSANAKVAIRHYVETWELKEDLFYKPKK